MRFLVPQTVVLDQLTEPVANAFARALSVLSSKGASIEEQPCAYFNEVGQINQPAGLSPIEAWASHASAVAHQLHRLDPRVVQRMLLGRDVSVADYWELLRQRSTWSDAVSVRLEGYDAVLCPTVPMQAPLIAPLVKDDALFGETNRLLLRNTFLFNFLDGCSISLPMHAPDELPMGLMVSGARARDARVLKSAWAIERALSGHWGGGSDSGERSLSIK
jgi:aspartyl-tRNA(Asn)/glutamyl-tRNA(Gln) amidotransferase subunit A